MAIPTLFIASILACSALAQTVTLPSCAQSCVTLFTTGSSIAGCNQVDVACICSSSDFLNNIACCLASQCDAADQATAVEYAQQICKTANVSVPDAVSCVSSSTSATATASATSASTSTKTSSQAAATTTTAATAAATKNAGSHNTAGSGAGMVGGLIAVLALI